MGKRFAIVIGVAAAGVMALGPQTAGARPEVVKYDAKVTIHRIKAGAGPYFHGSVESKVRKCMDGRRVVVFKKRPGADQKMGTARTHLENGVGQWGLHLHSGDSKREDPIYAKVTPQGGPWVRVPRSPLAKHHLAPRQLNTGRAPAASEPRVPAGLRE